MTAVLDDLVARLELERIEENIFRGQSQDLGWGRVFGGQVLGQALSAAEQTVPAERVVHSFHGYFLRPGDVDKPIVFMVDPIRDGGSFTTRRVVAVQDGRAIFNMAASFQVAEPGLDHQAPAMPDVPGPEGLASEREIAQRYLASLPPAAQAAVPAALRERVLAERPIEIRPVVVPHPISPPPSEPRKRVWFRANGTLPDRRALHELVLAYASDFHLLGTSLQPHGVGWLTPGFQIASLDHAMWFHRPFRFDDWMLYDVDSPSAQGSRGLAHGRWFTRAGVLVATTMQEGLIRDRRSAT
jgi:acyl-CoA thioesterase II